MSEGTVDSRVNDEVHLDPDVVLVGTVMVRRGPIGDVAANARTAVVTNHGDDSVSFVSGDTLVVEDTIGVPGEPVAVVVCGDRCYVSTSSASYDAVSVIDMNTRTVLSTYPLAFAVTTLAISPDGKRVYAGRNGDDHVDVAVIDTTAERVGTIDIATGAGVGVDALAVDPTGKRLYVATADERGSRLTVVDAETSRVDRQVRVGSPIRDVAFADGTAYVLTSDRRRGGVVHVIDMSANRTIDTVELGEGAPTQMILSPDKTRAYVVDYDRVAVVCTLTHDVVTTVSVDARPSCVAVDSGGNRLYVADYAGGIAAFSIASTLPQLYSQLVASTHRLASRRPRVLAPA